MPKIQATITSNAIEKIPLNPPSEISYGAEVKFEGVIRPLEGKKKIKGISFEVYEEMAVKVMKELLEKLANEYNYIAADVVHRKGDVSVGDAAIRVCIWAEHRKEAFTVCEEFMNNLKKHVPIWKTKTF